MDNSAIVILGMMMGITLSFVIELRGMLISLREELETIKIELRDKTYLE